MSSTPYPVTVTAQLDPEVGRGLWLVKWLLVIPHLLVLMVLWSAFSVLTVVAFFAILITGRYPRRIFDVNVGVMRWTWRVAFYAYGTLGTDLYPPFTLAEVAYYPAHLEVEYPGQLSRGLVLVKWWLLALPHYLVLAFLVGGGVFALDASDSGSQPALLGGGLIGVLVLVAAVVLLFTGGYPRPLFDLVVGLQRWLFRVVGYASLMTDVYPPFRLDQGGDDPAGIEPHAPDVDESEPSRSPIGGTGPILAGGVALGLAALLGLTSVALLVTERSLPHEEGFVMTPDVSYTSTGYAITADGIDLDDDTGSGGVLGDARMTASAAEGREIFVGVAPTDDVDRYLAGVARSSLVSVRIVNGEGVAAYAERTGGAPSVAPAASEIWIDSDSGEGRRSISFPVGGGGWTVVIMSPDASVGVTADVGAGGTIPFFGWVVTGVLVATAFFLGLGTFLLLAGRSSHRDRRSEPKGPGDSAQIGTHTSVLR